MLARLRAQWFYDRLNPFTHMEAYARGPAMTFECAESDTHVPPNRALRFQAALREAYRAAGERVRVNLHPGDRHMAGGRNPQLAENCLTWLLESRASGARG